jgi:hypothetical protein
VLQRRYFVAGSGSGGGIGNYFLILLVVVDSFVTAISL